MFAASPFTPAQAVQAALIFLVGLAALVYAICILIISPKTLPSSNRQNPYKPFEAFVVALTVFFSTQIIAGIIVGILFLALGAGTDINAAFQRNPWAMFGFVAMVDGITIGLIYAYLKRRGAGFRAIGITHFQPMHILYALSGFAVYIVLYLITLLVVKALIPGLDLEQKQELGFAHQATGQQLIPIFFSLVILPPLAEEIVVRGFLFGALRNKMPFISAALIASLLFAAAHLGEGGEGVGLLWVAGIDTFILSMVLCFLRDKSKSLVPSIMVHAMKNLVAFVFLYKIYEYLR